MWPCRQDAIDRQPPGATSLRRSGCSGSGFQPAITRAHSRACDVIGDAGEVPAQARPRRIAHRAARKRRGSQRHLPRAADVSVCQQASPGGCLRSRRRARSERLSIGNAWPCSTELGAVLDPVWPTHQGILTDGQNHNELPTVTSHAGQSSRSTISGPVGSVAARTRGNRRRAQILCWQSVLSQLDRSSPNCAWCRTSL